MSAWLAASLTWEHFIVQRTDRAPQASSMSSFNWCLVDTALEPVNRELRAAVLHVTCGCVLVTLARNYVGTVLFVTHARILLPLPYWQRLIQWRQKWGSRSREMGGRERRLVNLQRHASAKADNGRVVFMLASLGWGPCQPTDEGTVMWWRC